MTLCWEEYYESKLRRFEGRAWTSTDFSTLDEQFIRRTASWHQEFKQDICDLRFAEHLAEVEMVMADRRARPDPEAKYLRAADALVALWGCMQLDQAIRYVIYPGFQLDRSIEPNARNMRKLADELDNRLPIQASNLRNCVRRIA